MTHKDAVKRIGSWLSGSKGCLVVATELATQNNETPDALGFHGPGGSILVEIKVSRADFLADKNKSFRKWEDFGMGDHRYFAAPKGLLKAEEMPEGWGLLEIEEHCIRERAKPAEKKANKRAEVKLLMSIVRRLKLSTAVFVIADPVTTSPEGEE
jgi:hypothetical protein